jgi:Cdc6-like AAA superfamily ATPase
MKSIEWFNDVNHAKKKVLNYTGKTNGWKWKDVFREYKIILLSFFIKRHLSSNEVLCLLYTVNNIGKSIVIARSHLTKKRNRDEDDCLFPFSLVAYTNHSQFNFFSTSLTFSLFLIVRSIVLSSIGSDHIRFNEHTITKKMNEI